jgi:hypothetical protein
MPGLPAGLPANASGTKSRAMITEDARSPWPKLRQFPVPAKVLVTAILGSMAIGLVGALGQILIHDIIPTLYKGSPAGHAAHSAHESPEGERGDLLADMPFKPAPEIHRPIYESEQFVWTLRWTHIHLFGMNMIFIFVGMVTSFLDLSSKTRTWLITLPFIGILIDIASMWLKGYVSQHFFWLHVPGGGLFGMIFVFVFARAFYEMWGPKVVNDGRLR